MIFLRMLQHLFPNSKAFRTTSDKQLRQYLDGLSGIGEDASDFSDGVMNDLDPQKTREIQLWETQFALPNTLIDLQERRDRLEARWKALGGQSPRYIQDTLQNAGFNVFVHDWWVPGSEAAIDVSAAATARDPAIYLADGIVVIQSQDGGSEMQDGDAEAQDGFSPNPTGYPLVNKVLIPFSGALGDGSAGMQDGGEDAQDGGTIYIERQYILPTDPAFFPFFIYIGAETFPDHATVLQSRRNEFETLCLKICPTQLWIGVLVDYT